MIRRPLTTPHGSLFLESFCDFLESLCDKAVCKVRGHKWSNHKSSVNPGYWCDRCRRFLP